MGGVGISIHSQNIIVTSSLLLPLAYKYLLIHILPINSARLESCWLDPIIFRMILTLWLNYLSKYSFPLWDGTIFIVDLWELGHWIIWREQWGRSSSSEKWLIIESTKGMIHWSFFSLHLPIVFSVVLRLNDLLPRARAFPRSLSSYLHHLLLIVVWRRRDRFCSSCSRGFRSSSSRALFCFCCSSVSRCSSAALRWTCSRRIRSSSSFFSFKISFKGTRSSSSKEFGAVYFLFLLSQFLILFVVRILLSVGEFVLRFLSSSSTWRSHSISSLIRFSSSSSKWMRPFICRSFSSLASECALFFTESGALPLPHKGGIALLPVGVVQTAIILPLLFYGDHLRVFGTFFFLSSSCFFLLGIERISLKSLHRVKNRGQHLHSYVPICRTFSGECLLMRGVIQSWVHLNEKRERHHHLPVIEQDKIKRENMYQWVFLFSFIFFFLLFWGFITCFFGRFRLLTTTSSSFSSSLSTIIRILPRLSSSSSLSISIISSSTSSSSSPFLFRYHLPPSSSSSFSPSSPSFSSLFSSFFYYFYFYYFLLLSSLSISSSISIVIFIFFTFRCIFVVIFSLYLLQTIN